MKLLNAVTTNTTGTGYLKRSPVSVYVDGSLGSPAGTLTLQICKDVGGVADGNWVTVKTITDLTVVDAARFNLVIFGNYWVRAVLAGATNPSLTVETS